LQAAVEILAPLPWSEFRANSDRRKASGVAQEPACVFVSRSLQGGFGTHFWRKSGNPAESAGKLLTSVADVLQFPSPALGSRDGDLLAARRFGESPKLKRTLKTVFW
jgi:hypothetical protein